MGAMGDNASRVSHRVRRPYRLVKALCRLGLPSLGEG